jgi:hypothetical protein
VPSSADPEVRSLWKRMVHDPVHKALHRYQPVLKAHEMLDQVFRFQDLDALVDRLDPPAHPQAAGVEGRGRKDRRQRTNN